MILDYDLIRKILFKIEEISDGFSGKPIKDIYEEYFPQVECKVFKYHIKYLVDIKFLDASPFWPPYISDISPQGREYLNAIRSETTWKKINEKLLKPFGNVSFSVILRLLPDILKNLI